jgi:uncharacterized protein (TIGR02611 family)
VPTEQQGTTGGARSGGGRAGRTGGDSRGPGRKAVSRTEATGGRTDPAARVDPTGRTGAKARTEPKGRPTPARGAHGAPRPAEATPKRGGRRPSALRRRLSTTLALIRANPTGRFTLRVVVAVTGALVVTVGIILIPLPGPGWLLVIAGMGIWAVEFHWAKRLLGFTRRHVHGWTRWATTRPLPLRIALGSVGLVFVSVVGWLSLKYSLGIDVVARALHYIATN